MKRKALITATAVLLVAVMCLATASYAWFTAGTASDVVELQVGINVKAEGLYIAAADVLTTTPTFASKVFTTGLINEDLEKYGFITNTLDAVSTNGVLTDNGVLQFHKAPAKTYDGKTWDAEQVNASNTLPTGTDNYGYEYFAFYVKSDAADTVNVSFDGTVLTQPSSVGVVKMAYSVTDAVVDPDSGAASVVPANVNDLTLCRLSENADDYEPLIAAGTDCIELKDEKFVATAGNEDILDNDVDVENTLDSITLDFGAAGAKLVVIALWVEGQDPDCFGELNIDGATLNISVG